MPDNLTNTSSILLIGAGPMAQAYAKVLTALNVEFDVIGRSTLSAEKFALETGKQVFAGGLDDFLRTTSARYEKAIVATGTEELKNATIKLIDHGCFQLLVEKPGAVSIEEANELFEYSKTKPGCKIFIAYNRRFYASVQKLIELTKEDGGVSSFNFEFTEWAHKIAPLVKAEHVKENWFFANSTHVVDLAFFLGGKPRNIATFTAGKLEWHPVAIFSGAGITTNGSLFSYQANWTAPGRWAVEILTPKRRFYLKPLEKLMVQQLGSVEVTEMAIDDSIDIDFKPGLHKQTVAFFSSNQSGLVSLAEHMDNCVVYQKMLVPSNLF